jgi:hypothetical protein
MEEAIPDEAEVANPRRVGKDGLSRRAQAANTNKKRK